MTETVPARRPNDLQLIVKPVTAEAAEPQQMAAPAPPMAQEVPPKKRRSLIMPVILLAVLGFAAYKGYHYFVEGRFLETTDDAYIKADTAVLAAKISGFVVSVPVAENVAVKAGDVLATIDDGDYVLAVKAAENKRLTQDASLVRLDKQAEAQASAVEQAKAALSAAEADAQRAATTFSRVNPLVQSGSVTRAALDTATADRDRSAASVIGAQAAVVSAEAALSVVKAQRGEAEAARRELDTAVEKAKRDLSFTIVRAPFDGVVGNRAAQVGQLVQPGSRLMAVVPLSQAYIEANFKETQLSRILLGQKADLEIDALPGKKIEGTVVGVSPASGAEFSLLPPENATGNFTKIVQRIPVRISIPEKLMQEGHMRPGLSVSVSVRTRDENLPKPSVLDALGLGGWFGPKAKP